MKTPDQSTLINFQIKKKKPSLNSLLNVAVSTQVLLMQALTVKEQQAENHCNHKPQRNSDVCVPVLAGIRCPTNTEVGNKMNANLSEFK